MPGKILYWNNSKLNFIKTFILWYSGLQTIQKFGIFFIIIREIKSNCYITKSASLFTIAVGIVVLAGWFFNTPSFKSVLPGIVSMKFNTAVCFIFSGIALYLPDEPNGNQHPKNSTYGILLPDPEYNRLINELGGKSATKLFSLTNCALQSILKQYHFA